MDVIMTITKINFVLILKLRTNFEANTIKLIFP